MARQKRKTRRKTSNKTKTRSNDTYIKTIDGSTTKPPLHDNHIKTKEVYTKLELPKRVKIKLPPMANIRAKPKNKEIQKTDLNIDKKEESVQEYHDNVSDAELYSHILEIDKEILERYEYIYNRNIHYDFILGQINYLWIDDLVEVSDFNDKVENDLFNEDDDDMNDDTYYV